MSQTKKILIIEFCNYEDYPTGGYLTFAKNLKKAFGNELIFVGITTEKNDPIGKWFKKQINECTYDYFALARYSKETTKHLIPDRLIVYLLLKYYKKQILEINPGNVFIQRQEVLLSVNSFNYENICYRFAGLDNPLSISKYRFASLLARRFENHFFSSLQHSKTILASGDESAILDMVQRSNGLIDRNSVTQFPTRIDTDIYYPSDKSDVRKGLGIKESVTVILTSGRLAWFKGWKFMIDSFEQFLIQKPDSLFYFIGDGEDEFKIKEYIRYKNLGEKVFLAGRKRPEDVALYLNAADEFIMGSYQEGWSTSLSEAIVCGIPSCVTNFHSAKEIIKEGKNGYVINEHLVEPFVQGMVNALLIPKPIYNQNVKAFASNKLKSDLLTFWSLK